MLGIAGFREYVELGASLVDPANVFRLAGAGSFSIAGFALAGFLGGQAILLYVTVAFAFLLPLGLIFGKQQGSVLASAVVGVGSLYLGMPIFAAIVLRSTPGDIGAIWLADLAGRLSLGWTVYPRGLAWAIVVVFATWIGDTVAYLAGSAIRGPKLAPRISPNKTIAGAVSGLIGAATVGAVGFQLFGLGSPWYGLIVGGLLGIAGQFGDLAESLLKRQAGVKNSGTLIPGHGGLLDRIDALLFAFPAGMLLATGYDWLYVR
jgi:phosphatidate cytidylyltransferase